MKDQAKEFLEEAEEHLNKAKEIVRSTKRSNGKSD